MTTDRHRIRGSNSITFCERFSATHVIWNSQTRTISLPSSPMWTTAFARVRHEPVTPELGDARVVATKRVDPLPLDRARRRFDRRRRRRKPRYRPSSNRRPPPSYRTRRPGAGSGRDSGDGEPRRRDARRDNAPSSNPTASPRAHSAARSTRGPRRRSSGSPPSDFPSTGPRPPSKRTPRSCKPGEGSYELPRVPREWAHEDGRHRRWANNKVPSGHARIRASSTVTRPVLRDALDVIRRRKRTSLAASRSSRTSTIDSRRFPASPSGTFRTVRRRCWNARTSTCRRFRTTNSTSLSSTGWERTSRGRAWTRTSSVDTTCSQHRRPAVPRHRAHLRPRSDRGDTRERCGNRSRGLHPTVAGRRPRPLTDRTRTS